MQIIRVGKRMACLMAQKLHAPKLALTFSFQHHAALKLYQGRMGQIKRNAIATSPSGVSHSSAK